LIGPKKYEELTAYNYELKRTINLGIFAFIAYPILVVMKFIHFVFGNWGVAIIILTLLIKLVFYPLTKASYESMQKIKEIQPEIQALKERIEDQNTLHQEILKLYREKGVNPLGGCLPSLIQLPVFFGLFSALRNAIELRHAPYALWIKDLSAPQRLYVGSFGIPVLALIMGAAMLAQQKIMPSSADPQQKKIGLFMTIFFVAMFILYPFPSGLALYMIVNFTMSLFQQYLMTVEKDISIFKALLMASGGIFLIGYLLTLI
ncbi:MAG: membrane protein insertase YidC, partial [Candidatus Dadabacteria bacterium]